jgi:hypothetical protein
VLTHILHQYIKTSKSTDLRVPTRGTLTQFTCRGTHKGYPGARPIASIFKLVQAVSSWGVYETQRGTEEGISYVSICESAIDSYTYWSK